MMKIELDDKCYFDSIIKITIDGIETKVNHAIFYKNTLHPILKTAIKHYYKLTEIQNWWERNFCLVDFFPKTGEDQWVVRVVKCFLFFKYLRKIGEVQYERNTPELFDI